jgi:O-antigen/teichoic acid export membrane protein
MSGAPPSIDLQRFERVETSRHTTLLRLAARVLDHATSAPAILVIEHGQERIRLSPVPWPPVEHGLIRTCYTIKTALLKPSTTYALELSDDSALELPAPTPPLQFSNGPGSEPRAAADADDTFEETLGATEVKTRAAVGSVLFGIRSIFLQLLGLASSVLLAHLLSPSDFGIVALGFTLAAVGRVVTDAGIGMSLVRREQPPTRLELQAVTGYQLSVTLALVAATVAVTVALGGRAIITAVMMLSLPIGAFRTPGIIYLDRILDFRIRVRVEGGEQLAYFVWVCTTALLGWGAWSIATAIVVQYATGALLVMLLAPTGFLAPRFSFRAVKPFMAFGLRYQAFSLIIVAQDIGLISGIGAAGGLRSLGMWSFANRLLTIPQSLLGLFLGLGTPAYARLRDAGENLGLAVARSSSVLGVIGGFFLAPLAGCAAALIPLMFGSKWAPAAGILPGCCAALCIGGPIAICIQEAMFAAGDAKTPLIASAIVAPARLVLSLLGLHFFGIAAVGDVWLLAQFMALPLLLPSAHRLFAYPVGRSLVAPSVAFAASAATGWVIVHSVAGTGLVGLLAGTAGCLIVYLATLRLIARDAVADTAAILRKVIDTTLEHSFGGRRWRTLPWRQPATTTVRSDD